MGSECQGWHLGQSRHFCDDCGDGVHGVSPCALRIRNTEKYRCMNCVRDREETAEETRKKQDKHISESPQSEVEIVKMVSSNVSNFYYYL